MATLKSFTDIPQSKKLAEILSPESADMYYPWYIEDDGDTIESGHRITTPNIGNFTTHKINKMILPCWSLAALLNVLPFPQLSKDKLGSGKVGWMVSVYPMNCRYDSCWHDEPIDACMDMIKKLHELNLV